MNHDLLDQAVRDHYEGQSLSQDRLDQLKRLADPAETMSGPPRAGAFPRWLGRWAAVAAMVTVAILSLLILRGETRDPTKLASEQDLGSAIAWEIARNHIKGLPSDFPAESYPTIADDLTDLGFSPAEPERLRDRSLDLIGSRKCSIQGSPAAQIRLAAEDGRRLTLYQAHLKATTGLASPVRFEGDGLRVEIWREADLVFGLVEPMVP